MKSFKLLTLMGIIFLLSAFSVTAQDAKDNIQAAYDNLNKRDFAAFIKLCAPDFIEYAAGPEPVKTPQAAVEAYKMYMTAFPDLKFEVQDIAMGADGQYYVKVMMSGTNTGMFGTLPATGKRFSQTDVDIIKINSKGLATSHWSANSNGPLTAIGYGSVTNPSTAVIMKAYEAFEKMDLPMLLALCTDDATFDVQDAVLYPNQKIFKGKAQITEFFKDLASKNTYSTFMPWRFIADGDDVMILVHAEFKNNPTGKMYKTNYVHHFTVTNGKITAFKGVADIQTPQMMSR